MASDRLKKLRQELGKTNSRGTSSTNASSSNSSNKNTKSTNTNNRNSSSGSSNKLKSVRAELASIPSRNQGRRVTQKTEREIGKASTLINDLGNYFSGKNYMSSLAATKQGMGLKKRIETSKQELDEIINKMGSKFSQENRQTLKAMRDALDEYDGGIADVAKYYTQFGNEDEFKNSKFSNAMTEKYKDADYDTVQQAIDELGKTAKGRSKKAADIDKYKEDASNLALLRSLFPGMQIEGTRDEDFKQYGQKLRDMENSLTDEDRFGNDAYRERQWLQNYGKTLRTSEIIQSEIDDIDSQLESLGATASIEDTEKDRQKEEMYYRERDNQFKQIQMDSALSPQEIQRKQQQIDQQLRQKYGIKDRTSADNQRIQELKSQREQLESELYLSKGKDTINNLDLNPDFAELSKQITEDMPGWLKGTKEFVQDYEDPTKAVQIGNDIYKGNLALMHLTEDERAKLRYMWNTQGEQAVNDYIDNYLRYDLNERFATAANGIYSDWAKDNPVGMSALSVATNLGSGMAYLDTVGQRLGNSLSGQSDRPIDWNKPVMTGTYGMTTSTRDTVANEVLGGGVPGFLYQTLMSMADSGAIMAIPGTAGTVLLGGAAATNAAKTAKDAGASDSQALAIGALEGAAETIFERVSLGNLKNLAGNTSATTLRKFFMNILKQGGVEGSEEVFTTLANTLSEAVVLGDKSTYNQSIQQYLAQGYSQAEADKMATQDWWSQLFQDFMGGAISGGMFGAGGSFVSKMNYKRTGNLIQNKESAGAYVDSVLNNITNKESDAYKFAQRMSEDSSQMTSDNVGTLKGLVDDYANQSDETKAEAEKVNATLSAAPVFDRMTQSVREEMSTAEELAAENNETTIEQTAERAAEIEQDGSKAFEQTVKVPANETAQTNALKEHDVTVTRDGKSERISTRIEVTDTSLVDDSITLKLSNGEEVNSNAVQFRDRKTQKIVENAKTLVHNGWTADQVQTFIDNYDGKQDPDAYTSAFRAAVFRASVDNSKAKSLGAFKNIASSIALALNGDQIRAAYSIGVKLNTEGMDSATGVAVTKSSAVASVVQGNIDTAIEAKRSDKGTVKKARSAKSTSFVYEHNNADVEDASKSENVKALETLSKALGIKIIAVDNLNEGEIPAVDENGDIKYDENGNVIMRKVGANGKFTRKNGAVYVALDADRPLRVVLAHELTHFIQQYSPKLYAELTEYIRSYMNKTSDKMDAFDALVESYITKFGLPRKAAIDEVVADACDMFFDSSTFTQEMANELARTNKTLAQKIRDFIEKLLKSVTSFLNENGNQSAISAYLSKNVSVENLTGLKQMWDTALANAVKTYNAMSDAEVKAAMDMEIANETSNAEDFTQYSYKSLAEALGFTIDSDESVRRIFDSLGKEVTNVTVNHVKQSPAGALINYAVERGNITQEQADKQYKLFADIMNITLKTNTPFSEMMQFMGSTIFTGMKMNADAQYGTTYDFVSICTKTQAVIDAMSARMVETGRALTQDEIEGLYQKVFTNGLPVPCPECYVFTHWVGIGSLLDNINKYQSRYSAMTPEQVAKEYFKQRAEMEAYAKENGITAGKAKGALAKKISKEYDDITKTIEKKQKNGELPTERELAKLDKYEKALTKVKAMTWFEKVYFGGDGRLPSSIDKASTARMNSRAVVPKEVLFDLNAGGSFATNYPEAWDFRTTQGAGYGKAITPYAEAVLGEGILVTAQKNKAIKSKMKGTLENLFLQPEIDENGNAVLPKKARTILENARKAQKRQAFLGGQRFQSTSDARLENASDYLIAALEMQAMNGMVQVYTKVAGAVPAFDAWGFSINQSLMPLGSGLDAEGHILDTPTGGMNQLAEAENHAKYEGAGNITIGVNDAHIRALMNNGATLIGNKLYENFIRDFIIPYHASGGKVELINFFRQVQDPNSTGITRSTDYTRTQEDKEIPDDLLKSMYMEQGMSESEANAKVADVHKFRQQRLAILTGNTKKYGKIDMDYIRAKGNEFLGELYDKFNGGEWDGVKLAVSTIKTSVFPNEYWDTSVDYEHSGVNTQRYLDACERLGFLHRFSGKIIKSVKHEDGPTTHEFATTTGYDGHGEKVELTDLAYKEGSTEIEPFFWKTLVDRRMYGHDGQYLPQKIVSLNDTTTETVTSFAVEKMNPRQYKSDLSSLTAKEVAVMSQEDLEALGKEWEKRFKKADEQFSLKGKTTEQIDAEYMKAVKQGHKNVARRIIAEYAGLMGYNYKGYHGTNRNGFTVFEKSTQGRNWNGDSRLGKGFYFAHDEDNAKKWVRNGGTRIINAFLKMNKPLDLRQPVPNDIAEDIKKDLANASAEYDADEWLQKTATKEEYIERVKRLVEIDIENPAGYLQNFKYDNNGKMTDGIREYLSQFGYDGIITDNEIVVFEPNQIKSAEITYDDNGNVIPLSQRFNMREEDIRYSLKGMTDEQIDADYMKAVESGDMETAQAMVDEYAKMKGYSSPMLYHGTEDSVDYNNGSPKQGFRVFKPNEWITEVDGVTRIKGYFSESSEYSESYGYVFPYYVKIENPLIIPDKELTLAGWKRWFASKGVKGIKFDYDVTRNTLKGADYGDGKKVYIPWEFFDGGPYWEGNGNVTGQIAKAGYDGIRWDYGEQAWMPFNASAIKSADAVTYDKNGNIIPLSQRFNEETEDVYYSLKDGTIEGVTYINDGTYADGSTIDFIEEILNGNKKGETRPNNNTPTGWRGLTKRGDSFVYGRVRFGKPVKLYKGTQLYKDSMIEGTNFDIEGDGFKYYYPILEVEDFRDEPRPLIRRGLFGNYDTRAMAQRFAEETGIKLGETEEPQFQYSLKDTDSMSNREILAGAFDVIAQTDKEKEVLERYRESVEKLDGIQAKLDEARKEIHTIMFTKGGRAQMGDRLAELQANVKKWEKQLTLWDGKLIRLQASKPIRDIVTRARANEARQTAMKYRERIAGVRDSNAVKDVRRKLQKLYNDLKKKALHPTEGRYIPAPLMNTMLSVLETIDYRGGREDTKIHAKLTDMYLQYQELKKDNDYLNQSAYDEELNGMLDELIKAVGEKYVRNMNRQEINEVYRIVRAIAYTLNQKVKQIGQASAVSNYELGERAIQEINDAKGPLSTVTRIYNMGSLSPMRFFRMISGWARDSVMQNLAKQLNDGQRKMNEILMQGYAIFDEYVGSKSALKEFQTFHGKGDLITVLDGDGKAMLDKNGNEIKITHDMLVALYMHSLNEDNLRHVLGGGVLVPNLNAYLKGKGNKAYIEDSQMIRFSEEQLNKLFKDNLTTYDMKYAQTVHDFFNTFSKQVINETSMALNGYKKAEVDNYFPIHVDGDFLGAQFDSLVMDGTLEGMGILKQRVKSSKPIYLEGASDAVIRNLNSIAKYGGLAIPIKNFQRVYNVSTVLTDQTGEIVDRFHDSVQKAIGNKWGDMGKSYISELMSDLQYGTQGRRGWDTLVNKFFTRARGKFAQATLAMNLSVTLKQAASYPTAASELGWSPLAKALLSTEKTDLDTLAKYTPIMWIRSHGFVNTELGDAVNPQDWSSKVPGLMGWIQKMDIATVTKLAKATEFYIRQMHPELKVGSEDYWRAVADKFNDVVEKTQPNYTVMQRPEVLRSQNAILRALTMFMTQRLQNYNILFDAVGEFRAAKDSGDTGWMKTATRNLRRAVSSQAVAAAIIATMTMAVNMLMHRMKRYRDDDDEITVESFMGAFFGDMLSTVVGSFLGGSEIYEIINNFVNGTTYDVLDAPNITMVNDLIGSVEKFGSIATDIAEKQAEAEENGEIYEGDADIDKLLLQLKEMGYAIGKFFGVPAENAEKLVMGVYYYSLDAANETLWESDIERTKTDYYRDMAKALEDGDIERYKKLHDKAVDLIVKDSKYTGDNAVTDADNTIAKGLKTYLKKNDERIQQAAEARLTSNNDEYARIRKELIAEGYPESAVVGAINDLYDELQKGEQEETNGYVDEYAPDMYETSDIVNAYRNNNPDALDDIVEYYITEKGMSETEARAKIDEIGRKEIRAELYDAIDNNDISKAKENISSLQEHGAENSDISSSLTSSYKDMYLDYYIHSETGKMKELETKLHGLGLTDKNGKNYFDSDKFKSWISKYQEGTKQVEEAKTTEPKEYLATLEKQGSSKKGIITGISKKYHPLWEDYYLHDDTENLKKLESQLRNLNITDSYGRNHYDDSLFAYWREQINK